MDHVGLLIPVTEQLINRLNLPVGNYVFPAQSALWNRYDNLVATLIAANAGTAVGDTLDLTIETVGPNNIIVTIATFVQLVGNAANEQVRVIAKTSSVSWFDRIQARAIIAGGTAAFDFRCTVQGS
jgi:hypothetical protein